MEFRVLGPMEVLCDGRPVPVGGARQRAVLAAMLADANRVVSVDRLITAVWAEHPPPTARHQIRTSVSGLCKVFARVDADREIIATKPPGYALLIEPGELDAQDFLAKAAAARAAAAEGDLAGAAGTARSALALWRGPAWDGIPGEVVRAEATRLEEQRLGLLEACLDCELALGRHHEVVGELMTLASDHPLRERFHYLLMLALYRGGRQAQALEAYQRARAVFQDELGLDPSEELQQLQQAILAHDPGLTAGPAPARAVATARERGPVKRPPGHIPVQLPRDIDDFTGRGDELKRIEAIMGAENSAGRGVPVVTLTGAGGVGKSALAVRAAHRLADRFPDGLLYADLHGTGNHPVRPAELLARFLRALGVPGSAVPGSLDERAELYRNHLAGTRRLVVLDAAADEAQVRPLLPGGPGCAVLITSRSRLTALAGSEVIALDVLGTADAVEFLAAVSGRHDDVAREPETAARIVELCDGLPLALRIVGAKLAARPHWPLSRMAHRLHDEQRRLDELTHGDLSVRHTIDLSYRALDPRAQTLLRRLALLDVPDFPSWAAAAVLETGDTEAEDLLDLLTDAQLVQATGRDRAGHVRFRFPGLVRLHARERAYVDEPAERAATVERAAAGC